MKSQDQMKPTGTWEVRRGFTLPALVQAANAAEIERLVGDLPGVCKLSIDLEKHQIAVLYDASKTDYQTIVVTLQNSGFPPLDNWWGRVKGGWFQFTDTNARDNAKAPPPACCNKSPK
jgi:hypothetical protein